MHYSNTHANYSVPFVFDGCVLHLHIYCKSGNFRYMKFSLKKFGVLKNFRRVDVLRKYFNTKILQHSVCNSVARVGEETYGESNCHGRDF